jgi:hypothetical protein
LARASRWCSSPSRSAVAARIDRLVLVSCTDGFSAYLLGITQPPGHSLRRFPRPVFLQAMELLCTAPLYLDANIEQIEGVPAPSPGSTTR